MTEILIITTLTVLLMASLAVNGYLLGQRNATKVIAPIAPPPTRTEAAAVFQVPRQPNAVSGREQRYQTGRKIVSPSEAIARAQQERDGLVREMPKVPPAVKQEFLRDAGAVVASPAQ